MDRSFVVIADDFTGANDTGIQFLKAGYGSTVILAPEAFSSFEKNGAVILDTESRNIPSSEAAEILRNAVPHFSGSKGKRVFYKKVDSTLRGNIAAEAAVLREELSFQLTIFAPAYPGNKRISRDGLLLLDGVPVAETEMGRDPRKPVVTSSLAETLLGAGKNSARTVSLDEVREKKIPSILEAAGCSGVFCFDAETEEDLRLIAEGVSGTVLPEDVLWIGSAGLAEALVASGRPVLLVVGSVSPKSALQARHVLEKGLASPVLVDIDALLDDAASQETLLAEKTASLLKSGKNVLLTSSLEERQVEAGRKADAGERISESLAAVVSGVLANAKVNGIFITGGEAAIWIVRALGGEGTSLLEELEPGIPLVRLMGGKADGLLLVTKAGGFGVRETMEHCIEVLSSAATPGKTEKR